MHVLKLHLRTITLAVCLLLPTGTLAQTEDRAELALNKPSAKLTKRHPLDWKLGIEGQSFEDDFNRDLLTKFKLGLNSQLNLGSYFKIFGKTQLQSEQGQSQGLDNEPNRRSSGVYLIEAGGSFQYDFCPELSSKLKFGAIKAYHDTTSILLLSSQTFLGVEESLEWKTNSSQIRLSLLQSIPTSTTLSTKAVEKEPVPFYFSENISYTQDWSETLTTVLSLTHFQFADLPDKVAFDSRLYGNSVDTLTINRGEFLYGFEGYQPTLQIAATRGSFTTSFRTEYLKNTRAPSGQDQGLLNSILFSYPLTNNLTMEIGVGTYENQADSSPAFYNTWNHGHNNVRGEFANLNLDFKDPRFKILAYFTQFEAIELNPYQSDAQYFRLSLEAGYDDSL